MLVGRVISDRVVEVPNALNRWLDLDSVFELNDIFQIGGFLKLLLLLFLHSADELWSPDLLKVDHAFVVGNSDRFYLVPE